MDEGKGRGLLFQQEHLICLPKELLCRAEKDPELLNSIYKEIHEKLGMDTAVDIYQMFKGQQISFPVRLFSTERIGAIVHQEYDGTNLKLLAAKYGYSEKTVRRMVKRQRNGG